MAANFGVNVTRSSSAVRLIKIESSTPIGAVVSIALDESNEELINSFRAEPLRFFASAETALKEFAGYEGSILRVLSGINEQNAKSPLILSFVVISLTQAQQNPEDFYGEEEIKTKVSEALLKISSSQALLI